MLKAINYIIFNIFHTGVELIQNISRHGRCVNEFIEGVFSLSQEKSGYYISTGNYLNEDEISNTEEYLLQLNNYSVDQLKQVYLQTLKKNALSDDSGQALD